MDDGWSEGREGQSQGGREGRGESVGRGGRGRERGGSGGRKGRVGYGREGGRVCRVVVEVRFLLNVT